MGDLLRLPDWVETPDFSHVADPLAEQRGPWGCLNPGAVGNDWMRRNLFGDGEGSEADPNKIRGRTINQYTPDFVADHRQELGMSEHTPDSDFISEFIAHDVTGEADDSRHIGENELRSTHVRNMHTLEERRAAGEQLSHDEDQELIRWNQESEMLRSWGYDPEITEDNEVFDPESGLYVVRYDPLEEGDPNYNPEAGSITSFAGTHSVEDLRVDFDREVGSLQYEEHQERIQDLIHGGRGDNQRLTGHSLGGYLAQRAAVDATDQIDEVVTFQAGGLDHEHAEEFERNRGDIQVRHHSSDQDFVHLAGEQRLRGDTFHHHTDEGTFGHIRNLMCPEGDGSSAIHNTRVDEGTTDGWDEQDRRILEFGRRTVAAHRHALGVFADPIGMGIADTIEQTDRLAGHGAEALEHLAEGHGDVVRHVSEAGSDVVDAASDGDVTRTLDAMGRGVWNVGGDAVQTGGTLLNDAADTAVDIGSHSLENAGEIASHVVDQGTELGRDGLGIARTAGQFALESGRRQAEWAGAGLEVAGRAGAAVTDAAIGTGANLVEGASNVWNSLWD